MHEQTISTPLQAWIRARIEADGPVPFARFMEWALYHPEHGYYTKGPLIGPRGDFTTSPEASPAFGQLLARHVEDVDRLLGGPSPLRVVEHGPGLGTLARDLLDRVQRDSPELYERIRYTLVDVSPALVAAQRERLLPAHEGAVEWLSAEEFPHGMEGAVIANEVVDAFPVHVVENWEGSLVEHYVGVDGGGGLAVEYGPLSDPALALFLEEQGIVLAPGERVEVNLAADAWLSDLAARLERGVVLIIDYGDTAPTRYSTARREGTLLGYFGGSVTDNLLARPGEQDLTALVDFTALARAAVRAGFAVVGLTRQAPFLLGLGLGTEITAEGESAGLDEALGMRRGMHALIDMDGLGRFHVLVLSKGLDVGAAEAGLAGLRFLSF
ncbi:MAG TPA: SAM-dependent methyltransferase [Chloroflexia bacterium]|nr:SAM-dependent methyltransferase [Chloroflexia bacterium]